MTATLDLAKQLIACPSITPNDAHCQDIIIERLTNLGFSITRYPFGETSNFWARLGRQRPLFCFAGHTDVVPPGNLGCWDSPPFTPTERDGYLYGRGAADMKSSIAAMVTACERWLATTPNFQGSIAFLITSDEEGNAQDGTQAVLKVLPESEIPDWCLVGEASSEQSLGDFIKIGRRGSLTGDIKIIGKQGHIAYPELAKNPIHHALAPLLAITQYEWEPIPMAPFPATRLQFANLNSGTGANNVIPGELIAQCNLRFSPQLTPAFIQETVETILKAHDCEFSIHWRLSGQPFYTAPSHPFIQTVAKAIHEFTGNLPTFSTHGGTSDGRFFAPLGCAVLELGPNNQTIHQVNERILINELDALSALYELIIQRLF